VTATKYDQVCFGVDHRWTIRRKNENRDFEIETNLSSVFS